MSFVVQGLDEEEADDPSGGLLHVGSSTRSRTSGSSHRSSAVGRVKTCFFCCLGSQSINVINIAPFRDEASILWLEKDAHTGEPHGEVCRICWTCYNVGGFKDKYGGLKLFKLAWKDEQNMLMVAEFKAARAVCIELVNSGTLQLKGRPNKSAVTDVLAARARVVKDYDKDEVEVSVPMVHQTPERYKETHNGRTYIEDGLTLRRRILLCFK